jgi:hypothetical protein
MRPFRLGLVVLGTCGAQFADVACVHAQLEEPLAWSISGSAFDPTVNTIAPTGGVTNVFLWLCRTTTGAPPCLEGLASAQFGLQPNPF